MTSSSERASAGRELVGADAGEDHAAAGAGGFERAGDELTGARPIEAHAALRGVHGLGNGEAQVEEIGAKGECLLPIDRRLSGWVGIAQRIGDDMGGGKGDAVPFGWSLGATSGVPARRYGSMVPVSARRGRVVMIVAYVRFSPRLPRRYASGPTPLPQTGEDESAMAI